MNRIFTLTTLLLVSLVIFAQEDKSYTLTKNRVIYLTCDTVTIDPEFPEEPLEWSANFLPNQFNAAGMALTGMDGTDWNYQVAFRKDYTDPETGFTLNKGYYRGITLMEDKLGLYGSFIDAIGQEYDYSAGYKNLKKAILYFVPLPNAKCTSNGYNYNHDRLPSNGEPTVMPPSALPSFTAEHPVRWMPNTPTDTPGMSTTTHCPTAR